MVAKVNRQQIVPTDNNSDRQNGNRQNDELDEQSLQMGSAQAQESHQEHRTCNSLTLQELTGGQRSIAQNEPPVIAQQAQSQVGDNAQLNIENLGETEGHSLSREDLQSRAQILHRLLPNLNEIRRRSASSMSYLAALKSRLRREKIDRVDMNLNCGGDDQEVHS